MKKREKKNRARQFKTTALDTVKSERFYYAEYVVYSRMSVESEKKLDWRGGKTVELPRTAADARQRVLHSGK